MHIDALISGAGPAGSTAATLLARAGWSVMLIEKAAFPRRKVCGECIAASNFALLEALGIQSDIASRAGPELRRVALMLGEHTLEADLPRLADASHPWGRALGRETLDQLLLEQARAAGAIVLQPWSVSRIDRVANGYRGTARRAGSRDRLELTASVAIAAHGSWEPLQGRPRDRRPSDLYAFKAHYTAADLAPGVLPVLSFEGGYGGMVLADRGRLTLACCIRADRLASLRESQPGATAGDVVGAALGRECAGVAAALRTATRSGAWLACGPLDPGIHLRPDDEVFRIGNAAGEAHPIIGEGMSMAIQSAWLLCARLLKDAPPPRLRDRAWQRGIAAAYEAQWRAHFAPRLRLAAAFAHAAMRPRLLAPLLPVLQATRLLARSAGWSGKVRCALDVDTTARLASSGSRGTRSQANLAPSARTLEVGHDEHV